MELKDYPQAIASARQVVNDLRVNLTRLKLQLARLEHQVDAEIANNPNLKRGLLRRAERFRLLDTNPRYQELIDEVITLKHRHSTAVAELKRVRNEFSMLKLENISSMIQQLRMIE